jgi:hypothetical protein
MHVDSSREPRETLECLTGSLKRSAPTDSIVRKLYALIAQCRLNLGEAGDPLVRSTGRAVPATVPVPF